MPAAAFGCAFAASMNFGSAAVSFSCSVGNVPGCGTGGGLPGAGGGIGTTGIS